MKKLVAALILAIPFAAGGAFAEEKKELTPQQAKMAKCSSDSKGKKGDEHKAFMKECLSKGAPAAAETAKATPQQEKMKKCNAEGKGKKGDERKAFMKECLSK